MLVSRETIIICPKCDIPMVYDKERDFWKCPLCDGEFWNNNVREAILACEHRCQELLQSSALRTHNIISYGMTGFVPLPAGVPVPGRSSSKSGKKRKKPQKKVPIAARQFYLYQ